MYTISVIKLNIDVNRCFNFFHTILFFIIHKKILSNFSAMRGDYANLQIISSKYTQGI